MDFLETDFISSCAPLTSELLLDIYPAIIWSIPAPVLEEFSKLVSKFGDGKSFNVSLYDRLPLLLILSYDFPIST